MNKVFFTSDTHFGHAKVIEYENRPFNSVEEMDATMIKNWNSKVGKKDTIYILGDFCFANKEYAISLLNKLNGQKILIQGNHDQIVKYPEVRQKFGFVKDYYLLKHDGLKIALFHYPIQVWDCKQHGSIHLYGHIHGNKDDNHPLVENLGYAYNVGVDVNNFTPVELSEILEKINYEPLK